MNNFIKNLANRYYHKNYYDSKVWEDTKWMGNTIYKCPLDMWIYQEILFEIKPDLIIETGTWQGGSALYMAHLLDIIGKGKIITIDIEPGENRPQHERITYYTASSTAKETEEYLDSVYKPGMKTVVIFDSGHSEAHVTNELKIYPKYVSKDSYLIVEDTNVNNHPVYKEFGPGPFESVEKFIKNNSDFIIDKSKEKFGMTFNPSGYLKKIK